MNVLSLFDGISACRLALERAGHKVDTYYTAEIDKYAEQVSAKHYPDAIRLGDVTKWQDWDIDWSSIDLVTGGFPCQAWSVAGKQQGDKDPRGMLFWTMLDIMKTVLAHNPKAFFLIENVKMKKDFEQYITHHTEKALGHVEKHLINSALVSAQNRQRYYWTNIKGIEQPVDKGILLRDVIEDGVDESFYHSQKSIDYMERGNEKWMQAGSRRADRYEQSVEKDKAFTLTSNMHKGVPYNYFKCARMVGRKIKPEADKTDFITTSHAPKVLCGAMRGRYIVDGKRQDHKQKTAGLTEQRLEVRQDEKTNTLTTVQKDNYVVSENLSYRKLTPIECERLQTFPDNWTEGISNTQRYKALGNAWTVDVIAHIFKSF